MSEVELDQGKSGAFLAKMMDALAAQAVAQVIGLGSRLGLFETMSKLPASTSSEIAAAANMNERYIREWLAVMVTGGVAEFEPEARTYFLPPEHATWLLPGPLNMAIAARMMPLASRPEEALVKAFRKGGGVPYSEYGPFMDLLGEVRAVVFDNALVPVMRLIPEVIRLLDSGSNVADVGCGNGHAINLLARAYPNSQFTGFDFLAESLDLGRAEAAVWGLGNAQFEQADAAALGGPPRYDVVMVLDAMHDQAHPLKVARGIREALKPGGVFLCQDIAATGDLAEDRKVPVNAWTYAQSLYHCMTVSLALDGEGLGAMWGERGARKLFAEAGFTSVDLRTFAEDFGQAWYVCSG